MSETVRIDAVIRRLDAAIPNALNRGLLAAARTLLDKARRLKGWRVVYESKRTTSSLLPADKKWVTRRSDIMGRDEAFAWEEALYDGSTEIGFSYAINASHVARVYRKAKR